MGSRKEEKKASLLTKGRIQKEATINQKELRRDRGEVGTWREVYMEKRNTDTKLTIVENHETKLEASSLEESRGKEIYSQGCMGRKGEAW